MNKNILTELDIEINDKVYKNIEDAELYGVTASACCGREK